MTLKYRRALPALILLAALSAGGAMAECPDADEVLRRIEALGLDRSSRAVRFDSETPEALYKKAARKIGKPAVDRVAKKGYGVLLTEVPFEQWWQAINDEDRHQPYVPVEHSEVLDGTVRGEDRLVFQYAKAFGMGRWWASRVRMNADLFRASDGRLWEFWWVGDLDAADTTKAPVDAVFGKIPPMELTRGSWLLAPLGDGCTLVELFSWTRAGGAVGALEGIATTRSLRQSLDGMQRFAGDLDLPIPALDPPFIRPDGTPLGVPLGTGR